MPVEQENVARQLADARQTLEDQSFTVQHLQAANQQLEIKSKADSETLNRRLAESTALSEVAAARSMVCVPLMMQDRILGVVQVINPRYKQSFEEGELLTFTSFAHNAAIAIENARLYEEIKRRAEELHQALERDRWLTLQRDKLGKYVPKSVVDEIERDREQALATSTRTVRCTILFSDIKGFTSFTEANSPNVMVAALNKYHSAMNAVIDEYNGIRQVHGRRYHGCVPLRR